MYFLSCSIEVSERQDDYQKGGLVAVAVMGPSAYNFEFTKCHDEFHHWLHVVEMRRTEQLETWGAVNWMGCSASRE